MSARLLARLFATAATALPLSALAEGPTPDPYFGEALFHAYQGDYFGALERLDAELAQHYGVDERPLDSLYPQVDDAEFSVGDFELEYRMHLRAGRAIRAVLEGDVDEKVRNDAAYRLARIYFEKSQPDTALTVLDSMRGEIPDRLKDDVEFLRANVLMALERPDEAARVLRKIQDSDSLEGFAAYNLGIALLESGQPVDAARELDRAGRVDADDRDVKAIRDKANLVLGTLLFEGDQVERARSTLERVRLEGPFSNQALLRAGWAEADIEQFQRAVVPWSVLAARDGTDAAVQEAKLALPYAYSRLNVHGRAAVLYQQAVDSFESELAKLDASITSIARGDFLTALEREEIKQDKDWVVRLRNLPDAPETFYLVSLMASHDFQTALQNYLDLTDLRRTLVRAETSLGAFDDLIEQRHAYYEPRLPESRPGVPQAGRQDAPPLDAARAPPEAPRTDAPRPLARAARDGRGARRSHGPRAHEVPPRESCRRPAHDGPRRPHRAARGPARLAPRVRVPRAAHGRERPSARPRDRRRCPQRALRRVRSCTPGRDPQLCRLHRSNPRAARAHPNRARRDRGAEESPGRASRRGRHGSPRSPPHPARRLSESGAFRIRGQLRPCGQGPGTMKGRPTMSRSSSSMTGFKRRALAFAPLVALACSGNPDRQTLAGLRAVEPDLAEVTVADGMDRAMAGYRQFLEEAPTSSLTPEAMRRLADLQLEKEYGLLGDSKPRATAALPPSKTAPIPTASSTAPAVIAQESESMRDFEARAAGPSDLAYASGSTGLELPGDSDRSPTGPLEALALYDQILTAYPDYPHNDQVLYQKARAFDELGRVDEAIAVSALLVDKYPSSQHLDEIQFRRAEYFFTRKKFLDAEKAYSAIVEIGPRSDYFELALYKLGWTFYKQMLLPEALQSYVTLLDHKVETNYDFEQQADEADAQRIADSYRVISLCFSDLGGPEGGRDLLRHDRTAGLRAPRLPPARRVLPREASLPGRGRRLRVLREPLSGPRLVSALQHARDRDLPGGRFPEARARRQEELRLPVCARFRVLASLRSRRIPGSHQLSQAEPRRPGEPLSRALPERGDPGRPERRLRGECRLVPPIPRLLPDRAGDARDPLPPGGSPARERGLRPGRERVRAHRLRIPGSRTVAHRPATRRSSPIARQKSARPRPTRAAAPARPSRARFDSSTRSPSTSTPPQVLGVAVNDLYELREFPRAIELGATPDLELSGAADVGIRRSAWLVVAPRLVRDRRIRPRPSRPMPRCSSSRRTDDASRQEIVEQPGRVDLQAGRARERGRRFPRRRRITSCASRRSRPAPKIRPIAEYDAGTALLRLEDWEPALSRARVLPLESSRTTSSTRRPPSRSRSSTARPERVPGRRGVRAGGPRGRRSPSCARESLLVAGELYEECEARRPALERLSADM